MNEEHDGVEVPTPEINSKIQVTLQAKDITPIICFVEGGPVERYLGYNKKERQQRVALLSQYLLQQACEFMKTVHEKDGDDLLKEDVSCLYEPIHKFLQ